MYGSPVSLGDLHAVDAFDCGKEPLNEFLKKYARQSRRRDLSSTFVIAGRDNRVVGYYTLAMTQTELADAPLEVKKGLSKYPIPMMLLARLAIDQTVQGQGFGTALLKDAFRRVLQVNEHIGGRAMLVHAKDNDVRDWYKKYDFVESPTDPLHLFLLIQKIPRP